MVTRTSRSRLTLGSAELSPSQKNPGTYGTLSKIANAFLDGWLLMLAFGLLHSSAPQVPAFGYWSMVFVAFVLAGIVGGAVARRDEQRNGRL